MLLIVVFCHVLIVMNEEQTQFLRELVPPVGKFFDVSLFIDFFNLYYLYIIHPYSATLIIIISVLNSFCKYLTSFQN